jgi:hypothetical protein
MNLLNRVVLCLPLACSAYATTINFTTNAASNSCFVSSYNNPASACQAGGVTLTYTNAQGDSATLSWGGITSSIGFSGGPTQPVSYGSFALSYLSNAGDTTAVAIPQLSFALVIKEFSPSTFFYQPVTVNFSGANSTQGLVSQASTDLVASFSPSTVSNGFDTTFFVTPVTTPINLGQNAINGHINTSAAPEPGTWVLLSAGLAFFALCYGRKNLASQAN